MSLIPDKARKVEVTGSTVDFFETIEDGLSTYYFDSSKDEPPVPMVNAMCGLRLIKGTKNKLVMINHKTPHGLFGKLEADVSYEVKNTDNGLAKIIFSSVSEKGIKSDLNQTSCH